MEKYIAIMALIAPGFLVRKINEAFISKNKSSSDLEKTIISLLYGVPILLINIFFLKLYYKLNTISDILNCMGNIDFICKYTVITIVNTLIISIISIVLNKHSVIFIINKIRKIFEQPLVSVNQSPWEEFFCNLGKEDYNMPIEIIKNGKSIGKGFVTNWDLDGRLDKDIILDNSDGFDKAADAGFIREVKRIYYDTKNNILIKEYIFDLEGFTEYKENSKSQ